MKLLSNEKKQLSDSIDKMNEALDVFIQLYNESEADENIIDFSDETIEIIQNAINNHGKEVVEKKINTIIQEIFSL